MRLSVDAPDGTAALPKGSSRYQHQPQLLGYLWNLKFLRLRMLCCSWDLLVLLSNVLISTGHKNKCLIVQHRWLSGAFSMLTLVDQTFEIQGERSTWEIKMTSFKDSTSSVRLVERPKSQLQRNNRFRVTCGSNR